MANFLAALRSTPLWVKVFGIIALVLVLLFVILQLTGLGGQHGPGRHIPSGETGNQTLPAEHRPPIKQEGHQQ